MAMTRDVGPKENRSSFKSICSRKVLREDAKDWIGERERRGEEEGVREKESERERERGERNSLRTQKNTTLP